MKPDGLPEATVVAAGEMHGPVLARVGDTVMTDVRSPHPQTLAMKLETPAAVAHANTLLATKDSGWSLRRGCSECAWGKVAGCWRCGSR